MEALAEDLLVHVTSFFRDPEAFDALKEQVFPRILEHKAEGAPIRVWVPGCATGEEVYSLAIALLEHVEEAGRACPLQIFATDVSERTIERARAGFYPDSVVRDIGEERRRRYFARVEGGYRVNKALRTISLNEAFRHVFRVADATGGRFFEMAGGAWDLPRLRTALEEMLARDNRVDKLEVEPELPGVGRRTVSVSARPIDALAGPPIILLAIEDVTERTRGEADRAAQLQRAHDGRVSFTALRRPRSAPRRSGTPRR